MRLAIAGIAGMAGIAALFVSGVCAGTPAGRVALAAAAVPRLESFSLPNVPHSVEIADAAVIVRVLPGVDLSRLVASFSGSPGSRVEPASGSPIDLTRPFRLRVIAADGSDAAYDVRVESRGLDREIRGIRAAGEPLDFVGEGADLLAYVPLGTDRRQLTLEIDTGEGTTLEPSPAAVTDYSEPRPFRLRGWDGSEAIRTIRVLESAWRRLTAAAPFSRRDGAGLLSFAGRLWLLGGYIGGDTTSEVWASSDGVDWTSVNPRAPWAPRHCAGWAVHRGRMWVIGGDLTDDVWSSADGIQWKRENGKAPFGPRYAPYVVSHAGRLWLMGGLRWEPTNWCTPGGTYCTPVGFNDVWSSRDGRKWERVLEHAPWAPRGLIHGAAILNGRIWVMGGGLKATPPFLRLTDTSTEYRDVWSSADGVQWTLEMSEAPWAARTHFSVAAHQGRLWVLDGSVGGQSNLSNEVWSSADGRAWARLPGTPWRPRHATAVTSHDGALYLAGGLLFNDVWRLEDGPRR